MNGISIHDIPPGDHALAEINCDGILELSGDEAAIFTAAQIYQRTFPGSQIRWKTDAGWTGWKSLSEYIDSH